MPPHKGGKGKFALIALALVAVIAVSGVGLAVVMKSGSNAVEDRNGHPNAEEYASADDVNPANVISDDPTCDAWGRVGKAYVAETERVKWSERDPDIPSTEWSPEQRAMYEGVSAALTVASDATENLKKQTPHRVMRELYGQYIEYARAFVDSVPDYDASDQYLANATSALFSGLSAVCSSITYRTATSVAPLLPPPPPPSEIAEPGLAELALGRPESTCQQWIALSDQYDADTQSWVASDPKVPASEWSPEQKALNEAIGPVMAENADRMEQLGRRSGNPVLEDVAVFAAQYRRAFVKTLPGYTWTDNYLSRVAVYLAGAVNWACKAGQ